MTLRLMIKQSQGRVSEQWRYVASMLDDDLPND